MPLGTKKGKNRANVICERSPTWCGHDIFFGLQFCIDLRVSMPGTSTTETATDNACNVNCNRFHSPVLYDKNGYGAKIAASS